MCESPGTFQPIKEQKSNSTWNSPVTHDHSSDGKTRLVALSPEHVFHGRKRNLSDASLFPPHHLERAGSRHSLPVSFTKILPKSIPSWKFDFPDSKEANICSKVPKKLYKNLFFICQLRWGHSSEAKKVMDGINELELSEDLPNILAEMIYLVDQHPETALQIIDKKKSPLQTAKQIHENFLIEIKKAHKALIHTYREHQRMGFKNAEIAYHVAIPHAISRILIPQTGIISIQLIDQIIQEFISGEKPSQNYDYSLKEGLKLLKKSKELRKKIEEITHPKDQKSQEAFLIRSALNLCEMTAVKNVHTRRAALSALLTHLRQGENGSCFASFIAIELQSTNPVAVINDLKQLLTEGKLTRVVDQQSYDFPYLMKVDNPLALENFMIEHLSELPGMMAICHFLKITSEKEYLLQLTNGENTPLTPLELIQKIAADKSCNPRDLEIIFNSITHHPLLSIWENAIAGMAEALKGSILKTALRESIFYITNKTVKKCGQLDLLHRLDGLSKLEKEINERSHYLYDPAFSVVNTARGAFVLFDSHKLHSISEWTKIDSSKQFQNYMYQLIHAALDAPELSVLKEILVQKFSKDENIVSILKRYHRENEEAALDIQSVKYLRYTPWVTSIGNDPHMILKVYNEIDEPLIFKKTSPVNALELLQAILELFAAFPDGIRNKYCNHSLPARIKGVHAFSLLLSHATMRSFLEEKSMPQETIYPLSSQMRKALIDFAKTLVKKHEQNDFQEKMQLHPKKSTLHAIRARLIELLRVYNKSSDGEEIQNLIDLKIVDVLPKTFRQQWENKIIHIADTNWQSDINDIHYGIGTNPGSSKIELMCVLDNGKVYKFLDQNQFFKDKTWELYFPKTDR